MVGSGTPGTVLVTGATGYLAGWVIVALMDRGYTVRGTVRNLDRAQPARRAIEARAQGRGALELVQADLLDDAGWDAAFSGVRAVLHTASPMPFDASADLILSVREGTRRVLTAAQRNGVRRVVFTSSAVTAIPADHALASTEAMWSEPDGRASQAYPDSKILAERLAWELAAELGLELTAVLPSFMQGPPVGAPERSGTIDVVRRLVDGEMPALPRLGWNIVDVRDEAELHVLALESPGAVGQRYLGTGTFLWYRDVARIVKDAGAHRPVRVPTRELPNFVVRLAALRDPHLAMIVDELGITRLADNGKAHRELGWTQRDVQDTILDTARALVSSGVA